MADVHRGIDLRLNRPVAVKIFRPGTDPDGEQRFHGEAQTLANLNHPGLIAVHDFGVEQHRAYLIMELVEGPTLRAVLDQERLPLDEVARIGSDIANVLAYVHAQGVVHRDVKPSNVLLDHGRRARLADFGISRLMGATGLTSADVAVGTAPYMAPEQVRGDHVGPPADIYALGLVVLESVTGHREYPGESWEAAAERLSRPPAVPGDLPDPLRRALLTMTETDPARRPTARQAAQMLAAVDAGGAVPDGADPVDEEPSGSTTKRYLAIALGLVALLAGLVVAALVGGEDSSNVARPSAPATATTVPGSGRTTDHPGTAGGRDSGPRFPSPPTFQAPELPDLPTMPNVPQVPDSVSQDARGVWERFSDWMSRLF